jgi:membrane protein YqaA with SNARE-associated domain
MVLDPITLLTDYGWVGLALVAFLAASILPFPSDPAIVAAVKFMRPEVVFAVALAFGTLGSITNYLIGSRAIHGLWFHRIHRDPEGERRARRLFERYGYYAIVFAPSIPFIGDPLMIVAGALKPNFTKFIVAITLGRALKTVLLIWFGEALFRFIGF